MRLSTAKITTFVLTIAAVLALIGAMGGSWSTSQPAVAAPVLIPTAVDTPPSPPPPPPPPPPKQPSSGSTAGSAAPPASTVPSPPHKGVTKRDLAGKININTATAQQLLLLPTVGPAKAERILVWRQKNGGFKRIADLRRVKGFGYKTWKRLEPFLDVAGDTTLAVK